MAEKNSLWKNIRKKAEQNRRTGAKPKEPTKEMLDQEKKIKAKKYAEGGETDPPYRPLGIPMEGYEPDSVFYETPTKYSEPVNKKEDELKPTSKRSEVQDYYLNQYLNQNSSIPKLDKYVAEKDTSSTKLSPAMSTKEWQEGPRSFGPTLKDLDVVTDVMQLGNFVPHPAAQIIGKIGNWGGAAIDSYQAYDDYNEGNYGSMAVNIGSAALGAYLGGKGRGYTRDMNNTVSGSMADKIASFGSRSGSYRPLTAYPHLRNNPVIQRGLNYNRGILGGIGAETIYDSKANGGPVGDDDLMLSNIYNKYPAFRKMGNVTLKADTGFTREKTGIGDIEFFDSKTKEITYPNGYKVVNPSNNGSGIIYNPNTNTEQNIMLDMLHGMPSDPVYNKIKSELGDAYLNSEFAEDFYNDSKYFKNKVGEEKWKEWYGNDKGFFDKSYLDGVIRNLMFEGTAEDFKKNNYWEDARKEYFKDKDIKTRYTQLENYLKTGQGYVLPEVEIFGDKIKANGGPTKSLVQPPVLLDDNIIYPTDNPYMPGVNKDILDSEYDSYMRWREGFINNQGMTPEEYYQTYPSRQEWERKNFDPANLHNGVSLAQGGKLYPDGGRIPPGWFPLTAEIAKGRYSGDLKGMYYSITGDKDNPYHITWFEPPKPSINKLKSKQSFNFSSNQQPSIIDDIENISPLEINMDNFFEGQYEKYKRSPYEDPMYRVWISGQQQQIVPESEFKKLSDQYLLKDLEAPDLGGNLYDKPKATGGYMYDGGGDVGDGKTNIPKTAMSYNDNRAYFDSHAVLHDNPTYNDWVKKNIYEGKIAYDPTTGISYPLNKKISIPEGRAERATAEYARKSVDERLRTNKDARKDAVMQSMIDVGNNPSFYAPGVIAALPFVGPAAASATTAMSAPFTVGATTIPGATIGNALGLGFGLKGAYNLGQDLDSGYYTSNAPIGDKIARGFETGLDMAFVPGMLPAVGAGLNELNQVGKNVANTPKLSLAFESPAERLVNPEAYRVLTGKSSGIRGNILESYYNLKQKNILKAQNKLRKKVYSARRSNQDDLAESFLEKIDILDNDYDKLSKLKNDWRLKYSGLPITRTNMGGGQGRIFKNNLNENELIKVGSYFGNEQSLNNLIELGKTYNNPNVAAAFPTKAIPFTKGVESSGLVGESINAAQFMPKLNYNSGLYSASDVMTPEQIKLYLNELNELGIGIDYTSGAGNIGRVGNKLGLVDLTYVGPAGKRTTNYFDREGIFNPRFINDEVLGRFKYDVDDWLKLKAKGGHINPYMYYAGGPMYYGNGGKVWKHIGAGAYGILEGGLDTLTFGATDKLTDKGFDWLTKVGNKNLDLTDPKTAKFLRTQKQIRGYSNIPGAVGTAAFTGQWGSAIGQSVKGLDTAFQATEGLSDDFKKWSNISSQAIGIGAGLAGGSLNVEAASKAGQAAANFGSQVSKYAPYANQGLGMIGGNQQSLLEQAEARQDYLNSPEYLAMKERENQAYVNQGLSFAANGGPINNNLLTLQTGSMRENIKNHRKKYSKGGTFHKYGINPIPDSAGYHHKNAYGGVTIGRDAMAEGGEFVIDGNYVISDEVDGMNTLTKDGKTMAEIFDRYLSPYKLRDLNSKNKDGLRRPNDSISQHSIEQKKEQIIAEHKELKAKEEGKAQQKEMMVEGALQYAAAGGKLNKDLEKILSDDIQSYVEADNYYAYGGYLPKDKGFNMPNSYAKGGSIHIKKSKRGTFTAAAKKRGKSVQEFARQVLANKGNYSSAMVKKANFARNAAKWHHAEGGNIRPDNPGFNALPEYVQAKIMNNMAHGGPVVSNVSQDFDLYAQNRGGMMMAQGGNMYAVGGPPDGDPNSLDYITGVSDFMYSPEFLNYWTNTQDKRNVNYENIYDRGNLPLSEERFSPTEGISDFDRTLGNLYSAEKAIFLNTNPDGSVCYMIDGQKVCGPPGQIQAMLANRDRTYQSQAVADVYQNTTGDLAPYNYNNITGSTAARSMSQPDYSGNQNFTDRQNTIRGMVSNAMTKNQSTPVQPIERMQSRNLQQLPTDNTMPGIIGSEGNFKNFSNQPVIEEDLQQLYAPPYAKSNTSGFIPSDVMANRMGTPTVEGPLNTSIPRETSTRQNITEQNIKFVPPGGSDIIEDLPGTVPTQTKVSDEAIGLNQPNLPKLTFTQSDATKYGLNPNDVNIIKDPKINQPNKPNQGLTGLDYASMTMQALPYFYQTAVGLKGGDPVNYERVTGEKIDPTVAIALAAEEGRRAQDSAAYLMRQNAPTSGSYMNNLRNLSLQSGKQRAALAGGLRYQADLTNTQMQNELNKVNAGISMQEQIDRLQEKDAARTNVTEGLSGIGSSTANMIRDYRTNQLNQMIAKNIGTNNYKYDPINQTITYRTQNGEMVTVPAQTVIPPNVAVNVGTGQIQQPGTPQLKGFEERLNESFRNRFMGPNSGK